MLSSEDFQRLLDARLALDDDDLVPDDVICFTYAQIMHILGVSRTTVNRLVQRGHLVPTRVGDHPRVTLAELRRYLRSGKRRKR